MTIYDSLIAKAIGGSGGGGGSSDFSTAQVTLTGLHDDDELQIIGAFVIEAEEDYPASTIGSLSLPNGTYTLVLYKGSGVLYTNAYGTQEAIITGNYDSENQIASGDCTLTVSYTG